MIYKFLNRLMRLGRIIHSYEDAEEHSKCFTVKGSWGALPNSPMSRTLDTANSDSHISGGGFIRYILSRFTSYSRCRRTESIPLVVTGDRP